MQQNPFFADSHLRTCGGRAGHLPYIDFICIFGHSFHIYF